MSLIPITEARDENGWSFDKINIINHHNQMERLKWNVEHNMTIDKTLYFALTTEEIEGIINGR